MLYIILAISGAVIGAIGIILFFANLNKIKAHENELYRKAAQERRSNHIRGKAAAKGSAADRKKP
jgi:hypothetical protein